MTITPDQAATIRSTYRRISVDSEILIEAVYDILFASKPELQGLADTDFEEEVPMIFELTRLIVENLDKIADPHLLGETVASYDIEFATPDKNNALVVDAVLQVLAAKSNGNFTDGEQAAWLAALTDFIAVTQENAGLRSVASQSTQRAQKPGVRYLAHSPDEYLAMFLPEDEPDDQDPILEDAPTSEMLPLSIEVEYEGKGVLSATPLQTILDMSIENRVPHIYECGGRAKCSTCRVQILDGLENCLPRSSEEIALARRKNFPSDIRLACQTRLSGSVKLRLLVFDREDVRQAVWDDEHSIGREVNLAVLFADLRAFTAFTESNLPYDVIHILNRYFDAIAEPIHANHGYINKYIGDGVMVLFGLNPRRDTSPCVDAVRASVGILNKLDQVNEYLTKHFSHRLNVGIGIDYGPVIIGEIGSRMKKEFTAMGDTVNTASRIETKTKEVGTSLLVSDVVRQAVPDDVCSFGRTHEISIRGKKGRYRVHELAEKYRS